MQFLLDWMEILTPRHDQIILFIWFLVESGTEPWASHIQGEGSTSEPSSHGQIMKGL